MTRFSVVSSCRSVVRSHWLTLITDLGSMNGKSRRVGLTFVASMRNNEHTTRNVEYVPTIHF